jgi:hypothetical protein
VKSRNATRELRQSSIRKWRLWSSRDWVSYPLLGIVLAPLIGVGYWGYWSHTKAQEVREVREEVRGVREEVRGVSEDFSVPRLVENIKRKEATIPFGSTNVFQAMSLTSSDRINVTFRNMASQSAELYWIDLDGSPKLITTIQSGDSAAVETFVGHLWEATTQDGGSLGSYIVEGA